MQNLKDEQADLADGRSYRPLGVSRQRLLGLARADLAQAERYLEWLVANNADRGVIGFAGLPLKLAWAALEQIELHGAGAKVPRAEVVRILAEVIGFPVRQ